MARLTEIVIDSLQPAALARFWEGALDGFSIRAYNEQELASLAARGLSPETDPQVALDGPALTIFFQRVETPKQSRNRMHLDIAADSRQNEVVRLEKLGARVRDEHEGFTVMLDPEGNEFCVTDTKPRHLI